MGRSRSWAYSVVVDSGVRGVAVTPMEWRVRGGRTTGPGYGKPTPENLAAYVDGYIKSLRADGSNAHISREYGFMPIPNWAQIVRNDGSRAVVANWIAPMFGTETPKTGDES